ncbi:importin subunit alpha-4-like [Humulus lupulus]|uniref:importin subunit alpha-4-like n=1 Tax=Humulus lupulus TaxID=3486 RepID=UPI002B40C128|nr:importin subunit alpha-4-like [Humulus lupulus]
MDAERNCFVTPSERVSGQGLHCVQDSGTPQEGFPNSEEGESREGGNLDSRSSGRRRGNNNNVVSSLQLYATEKNGPEDVGFESCSLSDAGLIALGEGFPKHEKLSLIWCSNVSSSGLIALTKKCSFLTALDLQGCYVGDHGLAAVGQSCKQLGDLNLRFCEALTNAGLVELALGCGNSLKAPGIAACAKITDVSLEAVGNAAFLEKRLESIPAMVQGVWSDDSALQLEATTQFRKLLSIERSPPIDEVIKPGVVPQFVEFLGRNEVPQLQFEAAWALTNVASRTSEHTRAVINHGVVPMFVQLLSSGSDDVREQAVWALGNVFGDSPSCRDLVLSHGALVPLLAQLNEHSKLSMLRNATWTLSNFCRGKPPTPFDQVKPALPVLRQLIFLNDEEVLTDACWALSYLSDGPNDKIQAVIESGVCPRLVELLMHPSLTVLVPSLRAVGNIVTGDDSQTQFVIDNQMLPCLFQLLTQNHKKSIKNEACWTISNITAGNKAQIQAVIEANIIHPLVHLLQHSEFDIKKEAAWAISNATFGGSHEQIQFLISQGCIGPLCDLLNCPDTRIVTVCLEGLENILKVGEADKEMGLNGGVNIYGQAIDECEGLDKIENLQNHDNHEIYEKAVKILERYWAEEEDEEQNIQDNGDGTQQGFPFGANQPTLPPGGFKFCSNRETLLRACKSWC